LGTFGGIRSRAHDVSADGSVVVGTVVEGDINDVSVFRWTPEGSMLHSSSIEHAAVSADGSTVVGAYAGPNGTEGFRWLADGTFEGLGDLPGGPFLSQAFDVSEDGKVIVGASAIDFGGGRIPTQAFRWTETETMVPIADLGTQARAVSADGSVVVGTSATLGGFRWPELPGQPALGLPGAFDVVPNAVSADGSVIVGETVFRFGLSGLRSEAFRWTEDEGSVSLSPANVAYDVSADGSAIVGQSPVHGAFYWTLETGMLSLQNVLLSLGVTNLDGWTLTQAEGISPDGRTIVGSGTDPNGVGQAWIATIPEPSNIALAIIAALGILAFYVLRFWRYRASRKH
jgi:probable HAF family extracellular repeat protein